MDYGWILEKCFEIEEKITGWRRAVHSLAEVRFETQKTQKFIVEELGKMGLFARLAGGGVVCEIEGTGDDFSTPLTNTDGKCSEKVTPERNILPKSQGCVLLRADIDALPISEATGLAFEAKNGNMHACGHDIHTAALLGAAFVLCNSRECFGGTVKLVFQRAEEILSGAIKMIDDGVLENPRVDACFALHAVVGTEYETGTLILPNGKMSAPYADFFKIITLGEGGHGAIPSESKNAALAGAAAAVALEELTENEDRSFSLSICQIRGGNAPNVIPEKCELFGTLRALSTRAREAALEQIRSSSRDVCARYGCTAKVELTSGTEALFCDEFLAKSAEMCLKSAYKSRASQTGASVMLSPNLQIEPSTPSEDFAAFAIRVPSLLVGICAGKTSDGFSYPLHSPRVIFDERALPHGAAAYATLAVANLRNDCTAKI